MAYVIIAVCCGVATGTIARAKDSSFLIWFIVGLVFNVLGLVAAVLYQGEREEPERRCPQCGKIEKLYVQICTRCGTELYLPDSAEIRRPAVPR